MLPPIAGAVCVRMYRQGLGDCFLICLRKADGTPFYMMIDCGLIAGAPERPGAGIGDVARDIVNETKGRLDILVVTHEHWDHVSGFHPSQAQDVFAKLTIDKVWLAWTEDPKDKLARRLRAHRARARVALRNAMTKLRAAPGASSETAGRIEGILAFFGDEPGLGATGDKLNEAMAFVKGHAKSSEYLRPGDLKTVGVEGTRFYVLGPPEDEALIRKMEASSGLYTMALAAAKALDTAFFAAMGVAPGDASDEAGSDGGPAAAPSGGASDDEALEAARALIQPFDDGYKVAEADARKKPFFVHHYGFPGAEEHAGPEWRRIDADWMEAAGDFALQFDSYTNNTSLAFALELGEPGRGKVLLFPGDAQLGNWLSWFGKVDGRGKDMAWPGLESGPPVTAEDLLRRTVLYKVGHHGSHNATLRERGLEIMGCASGGIPDFIAMLPVDEAVAHDQKKWTHMPLASLVQALVDRTAGRVLRIDEDAPLSDSNPTLKATRTRAPADDSWRVKTHLYLQYLVR
jgi:hypothetical protein